MIKRIVIFSLLIATLATIVPATAAVPTASELSDAQLAEIAQNCKRSQPGLTNLQKRDTVLRINRGRIYDMTLRQTSAFITRLDAHKIDAPEVKRAERAIRTEFEQFMSDYDRYGDSLSAAIAIDCAAKPREFYAALETTAKERKKVGEDVTAIKQHINEYASELEKLRDDKYPIEGQAQ